MGYLSSGSGLGNLLERVTRADPFKGLLPNVASARKHAAQREEVARATAAMNEAARKQQLDLVSQAQAVAEAQTNMAMRQAVESKVASMADKPMASVEVSIGEPAAEAPSAQRAKRRKQFFTDGGYTPGVSI